MTLDYVSVIAMELGIMNYHKLGHYNLSSPIPGQHQEQDTTTFVWSNEKGRPSGHGCKSLCETIESIIMALS